MKCCFIVTYFGKLPDSFAVFLKTCGWNKNFSWLLFTDNDSGYNYPENFKVVRMKFKELKSLVDLKFGFHVALEKAYKLCDLRPAFGYIFEDYISEFEFWGHCDVDTIMGKLDDFITDKLLEKYDKLFCLGHFVLYRNSYENNRVFMAEHNGEYLYKKVFVNPKSCWFDEEWHNDNNINQIFLCQGKRVFQEDWSANFDINTLRFQRIMFSGKEVAPETRGYVHEGFKNALYIWNCGRTFRIHQVDRKLVCEEFMYMHFQQRKMRFRQNILNTESFKIVPNAFVKIKKIPETPAEFKRIRKSVVCPDAVYREYKRLLTRIQRNWKKIVEKVFY